MKKGFKIRIFLGFRKNQFEIKYLNFSIKKNSSLFYSPVNEPG